MEKSFNPRIWKIVYPSGWARRNLEMMEAYKLFDRAKNADLYRGEISVAWKRIEKAKNYLGQFHAC